MPVLSPTAVGSVRVSRYGRLRASNPDMTATTIMPKRKIHSNPKVHRLSSKLVVARWVISENGNDKSDFKLTVIKTSSSDFSAFARATTAETGLTPNFESL